VESVVWVIRCKELASQAKVRAGAISGFKTSWLCSLLQLFNAVSSTKNLLQRVRRFE